MTTPTLAAGPVLAAALDTPIGPLSLLAHGATLVAAGFTGDPAALHARLRSPLAMRGLVAARQGELAWLVTPVADYFGGDLTALDGVPVRQPGAASRQRLWERLRGVPPGSTVSYAQLAAMAGQPNAPRAAGAACAANLIALVVPCHRVLRGDGGLCGYYYGLRRKEWLLRHEGALPA